LRRSCAQTAIDRNRPRALRRKSSYDSRGAMRSVTELEDKLSEPSAALIADLAALDGDILVLGAGGKLGPSLTRLALRAVNGSKTVTAVSRFSDKAAAEELAKAGATVVSADITDEAALAAL